MKNWNKTGKVKAIFILIISLISLLLFDHNENIDKQNDFYLGMSLITFIIALLFFPLVIKLWSFLGIKFKKPNWNENPISLNYSKSLNFHLFFSFWIISYGFLKTIFTAIKFNKLDGEGIMFLITGVGVFIGIKLAIIWIRNKMK